MAITQILNYPGLETLGPEFRAELWRVAARLDLNPNYMAAVMSHESGFNPSATNPNGGATGLIQFMPTTARALGITTQALRDMSAGDQLKYVERFFASYAKKIRKDVPGDYLMATFMPAFIGQPTDTVLFTRGDVGYTQNAGFDHAGKGTITIGDVTTDVDKIVASARARPSLEVDTTLPLGGSGSVRPSPSLPPQDSFFGAPSELPVLRAGATGNAVSLWQWCVCSHVTGTFDAATLDQTRKFQVRNKLVPDGVVGPLTWGKVFE